jgi:uncharacterized protein YukE
VVTTFGDPGAVAAAAGDLRRGSGLADRARSLVRDARPELWQGAAADAYAAAARATLPNVERLGDALGSAAGTLERYAAAQREAQGGYEDAVADFDREARSLRANPLDVSAAFGAARARMAAFGALGRLQEAASIAADELRSAMGEDAGARPWWDPFGWFNDPEEPDERVSEGILDDDAFDPDDVAQGSIGDCFMLSSIVSLLNTDGGDEFLRDHVRWDPDKNGYWVTLYPNGEAEDVFVEHVYDDGARQSDWQWGPFGADKPSIAALYEGAISQLPAHGYDYLDGGYPDDAMSLITGKPVESVANENHYGLSTRQVEDLRETIDGGGQAVVSSPTGGEHRITVEGPDGDSREVEIVTGHSYVVTRVEADGSMWVRNPWGPGNGADGGGEFRVSADDVPTLFWRSASTNVTD